jgi:hypothetical protein
LLVRGFVFRGDGGVIDKDSGSTQYVLQVIVVNDLTNVKEFHGYKWKQVLNEILLLMKNSVQYHRK